MEAGPSALSLGHVRGCQCFLRFDARQRRRYDPDGRPAGRRLRVPGGVRADEDDPRNGPGGAGRRPLLHGDGLSPGTPGEPGGRDGDAPGSGHAEHVWLGLPDPGTGLPGRQDARTRDRRGRGARLVSRNRDAPGVGPVQDGLCHRQRPDPATGAEGGFAWVAGLDRPGAHQLPATPGHRRDADRGVCRPGDHPRDLDGPLGVAGTLGGGRWLGGGRVHRHGRVRDAIGGFRRAASDLGSRAGRRGDRGLALPAASPQPGRFREP